MQRHLDGIGGLRVYRWPGIEPDSVTVTKWAAYQTPDPPKRVAIIRAYRALFQHLEDRKDGPWLILQDDVTLARPPVGAFDRPLHLLGGYPQHGSPDTARHVHPFAFVATPEAVVPMLNVLQDETDQLCVTWTRYLPGSVSWEAPPTATAS